MVGAICQELVLQQQFLNGNEIETIYFGGGTPSLLSKAEILQIWLQINDLFDVSPTVEVTFECNPDDITPSYLLDLRQTPVNRLSIGVQSFRDADLQFMNRAHTSNEATRCIEDAQKIGFDNLTVDLIYGTPGMSDTAWKANIDQLLALNVPHLSCYALTVEPQTALDYFIKKGTAQPVDDEQAERQFILLVEWLTAAGYRHYETSNFALPSFESRHNSSYWKGTPYLGIGPSAHSYLPGIRQWNIANNAAYLKSIHSSVIPFEREELSLIDQYNERVMVGLRLDEGVQLEQLQSDFGTFAKYFEEAMQQWIIDDYAETKKGAIRLTKAGKFLADGIAASCFLEEE